jgi:hypothetical protein
LNQTRFCRSEGIAPITLIRWRREFGDEVGNGDAGERFVRIDLGRGAGEKLEVELAGGIRVRVPAGFDGGDLERLLGILARC